MIYPYSNPNLGFRDFISSFFLSDDEAEKRLKNYFSDLTGKEYILVTNSCRTALYLAYKAIRETGEIITSPLTCKVAIDPIMESGNRPVFADIQIGDLNIDPDDIEHRVTKKTLAIQVIHFGGVACGMEKIKEISAEHRLLVIEDCAQSLGAVYKGKNVGSFGDIACFSLIKNAYGIGGGIFATDSKNIFIKVRKMNDQFEKPEFKLILYRAIRNLFETKRNSFLGRFLYNSVLRFKGEKKHYKTVKNQLKRISNTEIKIAAHQISKFQNLHQKRINIGKKYLELLSEKNFIYNNEFNINDSSFSKLFIYNPLINSKKHLELFNNAGIEVMHLEQKHGSPYQERLVHSEQAVEQGLLNYNKVHDCLISLPISESFTDSQVYSISSWINRIYIPNN